MLPYKVSWGVSELRLELRIGLNRLKREGWGVLGREIHIQRCEGASGVQGAVMGSSGAGWGWR